MKRTEFTTNIIEWAVRPPDPIPTHDIRYLKPGWFRRLRKWLFEWLSTPHVQVSYELRQFQYSTEHIGQLVSEVINRDGHQRLGGIDFILMSPETAFGAQESLMEHACSFNVPIAMGPFPTKIYDIPVVVLNTYTHDDVLIVPKKLMGKPT